MAAAQRKIGIIGIGFGAAVHAPGFRSEGWDVAAICSRNPAKAREAAAAAGIADVHTDPYEMIRREDLAAISIVTPPAAHHDLAIAASPAGDIGHTAASIGLWRSISPFGNRAYQSG
jgi:predicted dehydrogenase